MEQFLRTQLLFGEEKLNKLQQSRVAVIGLGAVGSFAAEALARSGIGEFLLIDSDTVQITNLNRQLFALHSTLGKLKTETAKERILDINPKCKIETMPVFVNSENIEKVLSGQGDGGIDRSPDIVIDAIDSFSPKVALLEYCFKNSIPVVSSMGAALKTDPSKIRSADLFETSYCKLAERLRGELRKCGITSGIPCVFSEQPPQIKPSFPENLPEGTEKFERNSAKILGSYNVITGIFGLMLADLAIKRLMK
ncbi:MAG: tRNA threonylcarbamoyladenosine dehydratase [Endomicrobia bacterium]|nr:tRNA threonylcarbamoyladenosine dehydratase [Endomicrobiia bacterium]MCL2507150.1 tRNA threonylcarbamoyladenosine dehydratase [Endomicrobiia bacterium]